jgi:uridine kinase
MPSRRDHIIVDSDKDIQISIAGCAATGKSTIMRIIFDALKEKGFDNIIIDDFDYHHEVERFLKATENKEPMIKSSVGRINKITLKQIHLFHDITNAVEKKMKSIKDEMRSMDL